MVHKGLLKSEQQRKREAERYWIDKCNAANPPELRIPYPKEDAGEVVTIPELVGLVVDGYQLPASEVWEMTLPDILLMLNPVKSDDTPAKLKARELDERRKLLDGLSLDERLELARWKRDHR